MRVDSGVEEGGEITPFYDPMIAKLIAHADTREKAAAGLAEACRSVEVWPVKTNAAFLARCAGHPDFVAATLDTGFIADRLEALTAVVPPCRPRPRSPCCWKLGRRMRCFRPGSPKAARPASG